MNNEQIKATEKLLRSLLPQEMQEKLDEAISTLMPIVKEFDPKVAYAATQLVGLRLMADDDPTNT